MTPDNELSDNVLLTLDELRNIPGFENISEEQGQELIQTVAIFCEIAVSIYLSSKKKYDQDEGNSICNDDKNFLL